MSTEAEVRLAREQEVQAVFYIVVPSYVLSLPIYPLSLLKSLAKPQSLRASSYSTKRTLCPSLVEDGEVGSTFASRTEPHPQWSRSSSCDSEQ